MTEKKVFEEVKAYLLENEEELKQAVLEVNTWNGELEEYVWIENDEYFFDNYFEGKPNEAVRAVCFGEYNYNDDYVQFNAYGNLVTANEYTIIREMKDGIEDIANYVIDHAYDIDLPAELMEIIEQGENEGDEE
ncbi:hypothetical protein LD13_gp016 [Bacillus phage Bobb]|uniref:Uncharacterized protein n=1 Tax=Bacillus phage Bobb TaxID=1527469 RepID=A0A076G6M0_9CAUD|nr:hypothetical protein LD13_gp016 [Bacillus phage Bobb]AII27917.1 hypothetical protein [Bacillus phage Bobb]